jgi:hypothetical protein
MWLLLTFMACATNRVQPTVIFISKCIVIKITSNQPRPFMVWIRHGMKHLQCKSIYLLSCVQHLSGWSIFHCSQLAKSDSFVAFCLYEQVKGKPALLGTATFQFQKITGKPEDHIMIDLLSAGRNCGELKVQLYFGVSSVFSHEKTNCVYFFF